MVRESKECQPVRFGGGRLSVLAAWPGHVQEHPDALPNRQPGGLDGFQASPPEMFTDAWVFPPIGLRALAPVWDRPLLVRFHGIALSRKAPPEATQVPAKD